MRTIVLVSFFLLPFFLNSELSYAQRDTVTAKIAILHNFKNDFKQLKSYDRVKVGDGMRIFIQPKTLCYLTIIISDDRTSQPLIPILKELSIDDTLLLPSPDHFYIFENSDEISISIICSLKKLELVKKLFENQETVDNTKWQEIENQIINRQFNDNTEKPYSIAGTVSSINEEFLEQQRYFTQEGLILRKFRFEVTK